MIRTSNREDTDRIMDIWFRANISAHSFIPGNYWEKNYAVVRDTYLPASESYVYEDNDGIKGFISIMDNSFIGALFIDEENQGKGIGRELLDYCKSLYPCLELTVYTKNERAVDFYKKNGFETEAEQPNSISGFSEYLMVWKKDDNVFPAGS